MSLEGMIRNPASHLRAFEMSVHPAREEKPSSRVAVFQNSPSADGIWVVAKVKMSRDCRKTEVENKK